MEPYRGLIEKYASSLPVTARTPRVTLLEGATPLIAAPRLAARLGLPEDSLYLKFEGLNPTGSFKDRGMTMAVSKAVEDGARGVLCASTGNTAASAAAYAARASLRCLVLLPAGGVAAGKLSQALIHGAQVIAIRGSFDQALELAREAAAASGWTLVNSVNPYRLQGQKTAAFEIVETLGRAPDYQFMPVGNAGNITAYWMGYVERGMPRPRMMGFRAADPKKTMASAIRISNPASWTQALAARDESAGMIGAVTDPQILSAYKLLASLEGVFCEPSSAAGVAGLIAYAARNRLRPMGKAPLRVVCVLTGHGLKDPDTPKNLGFKLREIPAQFAALKRLLKK